MSTRQKPSQLRRIGLHLFRALLLVSIVALIHVQHREFESRRKHTPPTAFDLEEVRALFPNAAAVAESSDAAGRRPVLDAQGMPLGYLVQTSPAADQLIGFSGPTNTLLGFDDDDRIVGLKILSSGDTREHVAQIVRDPKFFRSFHGLAWGEVASAKIDAVSGATLTSLAIQAGIIQRLGGGRQSLRFPDPLTTADAQPLFPKAHKVQPDETLASLWRVLNKSGVEIGTILRTTPFADDVVGYQGPTEARIGFDPTGQIIGIAIGRSYDNAEYVTYVREDDYFLSLFNKLKLAELAQLDLEDAEVEGVSGATLTSMAVADGLIAAAREHQKAQAAQTAPPPPVVQWTWRDLGTALIIVGGLLLSLTRLRGRPWLRFGFQLLLIGYLGLVNGDMVSQAMLAGWAQSGVPWSRAGGLVLLTLAAFLAPLTTRRNVYCTHLCPHGAAQQLLKNRLPWRIRLPEWLTRCLKWLPGLLLVWCVVVVMAGLPFSLVDIEPFDAWVIRIAGGATIAIAVLGLVAALFVPMAYCRFGCPTGALLGFLRWNSRSDVWSRRDTFCLALVALALGLWIGV